MKTLKITTHFTTEEADTVYQFLDEVKNAIWNSYGDDIIEMHKQIAKEQREQNHELNDDLPF
ncbi:hypothetical protein [Thalassotalea sp. ND16A]|uniref:hypothetical protein n=1 Tax=Thalassotalea sp. ND16A TaxID=1535422 RepID=UPI00051A4F11|nr:hypothetical protein [Thalassotalea sp. ND16A]KGJ96023.1 hypothetical protein ND16A_1116 [Thalassotalea sp. ND16A]